MAKQMAFYIIKCEDKYYASQELYKAAFRVGDAGLIKHNVLTVILNAAVAALTPEQHEKVKKITHTYQDFDEQIRGIDTKAVSKFEAVRVPEMSGERKWKYKGVTFVLTADVPDPRRYRLLPRFPVVRVCGCVYIALNAIDVRIDNPLVLKEIK
jgi:hypothetical protein